MCFDQSQMLHVEYVYHDVPTKLGHGFFFKCRYSTYSSPWFGYGKGAPSTGTVQPPQDLPDTECLKDTIARVAQTKNKWWRVVIFPEDGGYWITLVDQIWGYWNTSFQSSALFQYIIPWFNVILSSFTGTTHPFSNNCAVKTMGFGGCLTQFPMP